MQRENYEEILDVRDLQKWNCIIEPTQLGSKSYGGVYLGDIDCAQDPYLLRKLQIGALLSVIDEPEIYLPSELSYIIREIIAVPDSLDLSILDYLPRCSEFIERHRKHTNVMVHCFAGISRSATCVIAYLMEKFDWGYKRAFEMVKAIRKQVKPNEGWQINKLQAIGFKQQLKEYEIILRERRFVKYGNQQRIPTQSSEKKSQEENNGKQMQFLRTMPQSQSQVNQVQQKKQYHQSLPVTKPIKLDQPSVQQKQPFNFTEQHHQYQQSQSQQQQQQQQCQQQLQSQQPSQYQQSKLSQQFAQFQQAKNAQKQHSYQMQQKNHFNMTNAQFDNNGILKVINNQLQPKEKIADEIAKRQQSLLELQQKLTGLQIQNNIVIGQNGITTAIPHTIPNVMPNSIPNAMPNTTLQCQQRLTLQNRSMTRERIRKVNSNNQSYQDVKQQNFIENSFQPHHFNSFQKVINQSAFGVQPFNSLNIQIRNS